jgi:subtilisin family serine protease
MNKKNIALMIVLTAMLANTMFMIRPTLSAAPGGGEYGKTKIYGISADALTSELGADAPIIVSIYGSQAGIDACQAYAQVGRQWPISDGQYMVRAITTPGQLGNIEAIPEVTAIWTKMKPQVPDASAPNPDNVAPETDMFAVRDLLGVDRLYHELGLTGAGTRIAIIDTGVDYAVPDLHDALDYAALPNGGREPLVLDADESQVLVLASFTKDAAGYIETAGTTALVYEPDPVVISVTRNYKVDGIPSQSGVYKFGMTYEYGVVSASAYSARGVLLTDPTTAGVYDTAYLDFDNAVIGGAKDFTNDPAYTYGGDRVTIFPYGTGYRSLGTLGGFFYDTYLWFGPFATFMPGWDRAGNYLSIFYDFGGHGTGCAGVAASRGVTTFNVPSSGFPPFNITGIAPGAKVVGIKGLWFGNTEPGMLWAAGFDVDANGKFYYTGSKRADIDSNSWGTSSMIYDKFGFGYDLEGMFMNGIATPGFLDPNFPGLTIVNAAGNGGWGYGTVTSPGTASMIITVGASTTFYTAGYQFGYSNQGKSDDIISWSARAPTPVGEIKPDVMNSGAYAFDIARLVDGMFQVFSGTSQATPLTAGVVALMLEGCGRAITSPQTLRNILQTTAKDLGYNALVQASGRVNAYDAVMLAKKLAGGTSTQTVYNIYSYESTKNLEDILGPAWYLQWGAFWPSYFMSLMGNVIAPPSAAIPDIDHIPSASLFLGRLREDLETEFKLYINNPNTEDAQIVSAKALTYTKIDQTTISDTLYIPASPSGDGVWNYIMNPSYFIGSDLTKFNLYVDFSNFDTNYDYTWNYRYRLYVFEWNDTNGDNVIDNSELRLYDYSYVTGTTQETPVGFLYDRLSFPATSKIVVRVEGTKNGVQPALSVPINVVVTKYARTVDNTMHFELDGCRDSRLIRAGRTAKIEGELEAPRGTTSGVHEGLIEVQIQSHSGLVKRIIPYTYVVVTELRNGVNTLTPAASGDAILYDLGVVRGSFDWRWRDESGDWRVYAVSLEDFCGPNKPFALQVDCKWTDPDTSVDLFALGPDGQFAGLYYGTGIGFTSHLGSAGSNNLRFEWHSVYNPSGTATLESIIFPQTDYIVNQYGYKFHRSATFTILVHEVLHAGKRLSEPITVTVTPLLTKTRLESKMEIKSGNSKPLVTSVKLPYQVAVSPTSPSPSNTYSLIFDGIATGPVTLTPTLPVSFTATYPAGTLISTSMINLQANVASVTTKSDNPVATLIETTLPDLRVFSRTGTSTYSEYLPLYVFQDWTVVRAKP